MLKDKCLSQLPFVAVRACIANTKDLWSCYPKELQVKIAFRMVEEPLRDAHKTLKGTDLDKQVGAFGHFISKIRLDLDLLDLADVEPAFPGEAVTITDVLSMLWVSGQSSETEANPVLVMNVDAALQSEGKPLSPELLEVETAAKAGVAPCLVESLLNKIMAGSLFSNLIKKA